MLLEKNRLLPPVIRMLSTPHSRKRPRIAIPIAIGTAFQVHCGGNGNETSQSRSSDGYREGIQWPSAAAVMRKLSTPHSRRRPRVSTQ